MARTSFLLLRSLIFVASRNVFGGYGIPAVSAQLLHEGQYKSGATVALLHVNALCSLMYSEVCRLTSTNTTELGKE